MDTNFRPAGIGDNSLAAMQDNDRLPALLHEAQELAGVVDVWVMRVPDRKASCRERVSSPV